ncbi:MAG TPA: hypothetical protein VMA55_01830 [Acidovorax sp.]|nr:hypothetical protein [Acidovorax sp.]
MTIVQRTPNLGLTLRMQRSSKPTAAASSSGGGGSDDVLGGSWLVPGILDFAASQSSSSLPDGRLEIVTGSLLGYSPVTSIWEGEPDFVDPDGQAWPRPGPGFRCVEITVDTTEYMAWPGWTFFGVLQGAGLIDAHWALEWDSPASGDTAVSARGHRARTYANVVQVELVRTDTSTSSTETLTATAIHGGAVVAILKLTAVGIAA